MNQFEIFVRSHDWELNSEAVEFFYKDSRMPYIGEVLHYDKKSLLVVGIESHIFSVGFPRGNDETVANVTTRRIVEVEEITE